MSGVDLSDERMDRLREMGVTDYLHDALRVENRELLDVLRDVETWWLEQGMKESLGAPLCIFRVRSVLMKHNRG